MRPISARLSVIILGLCLGALPFPGKTQPPESEQEKQAREEQERQEREEQVLNQRVTVNYDDLPAVEVVRDLSAKTSVPMAVVPGLAPVRLMVKTHEMPLHRLMQALSMVLSPGADARCHWLKQPDDAAGARYLLWPEPSAVEAQGRLLEEDQQAFQKRYLQDIFEQPEQFGHATPLGGKIFRTLSPENQRQALETAYDLGPFNEASEEVQQAVRDLFARYKIKVRDESGEMRPVDVDREFGDSALRFERRGTGLDQLLWFIVKGSERGKGWGLGRLVHLKRERALAAQGAVASTDEDLLAPLRAPLPGIFYQEMIDETKENTMYWEGELYPTDSVDIAKVWQWLGEHTPCNLVALRPSKGQSSLPAVPVANLEELLNLLVQTHAITWQISEGILVFRPAFWYHDPPLLPSEDVLRWQAVFQPGIAPPLDLLAEIATLNRAQYQGLQYMLPDEVEIEEARPFLLFYLSVPSDQRLAMIPPFRLNLQGYPQPAAQALVQTVRDRGLPPPPLGVADIGMEESEKEGQRVVEYWVNVIGVGVVDKTFTVRYGGAN